MADRAEKMWKSKNGILFRAEFGEVEVTTNDTITLGGFASNRNLDFACLIYQSDGTEMNVANAGISISNNQITVDKAAVTNQDCVYLAYGYKA